MKTREMIVALLLSFAGATQTMAQGSPAATLDALYAAGARSSQEAFFPLLDDNAVFLGVAGDERLQGRSAQDYFTQRFANGEAWTFTSSQRDITVSADGSVAWFDESLRDQDAGNARASGVLVRTDAGWKLAQYNLAGATPAQTGPVPAGQQPAAAITGAGEAAPGTAEKPQCRKLRHKTNKVSSC